MAEHAGLDDLEAIMNCNLQRAMASSQARVPLLSQTTPGAGKEVSNVVIDGEGALRNDDAAASFGNPLPSAASISLALQSVLTFRVIHNKNTRMIPGFYRSGATPAVSETAFSQKKGHSREPMMASATVQKVLDILAETPATIPKKSENYVSAFPEYQRLHGPVFKDLGSVSGLRRASIVWFRNDLRVHDNEALISACRDSLSILPVYIFDPRDYGNSSLGIDKNGPYRVKFLLECIANLRSNLRERGSDLIVRIGKPEEVLIDLAKSVGAEALYAHQEVAYGELQEGDFIAISSNSYTPWLSHKGVAVKRSWSALKRGPFQAQEKVAAAFQEKGVETIFFWGGTLVHLEDLPFELEDMPSNYGGFREKVQNLVVRSTIEAPQELKGLPTCGIIQPGHIPSLQELGLNAAANLRQEIQISGGAILVGGEDEALSKLQKYVLETNSSKVENKQSEHSANNLYGANFSCKISPWLALGCLSPRRMFEDLKKSGSSAGVMSTLAVNALATGNEDNGLNWVLFELLWRDFFRFITKKYGTDERGLESTPSAAGTASLGS